MLSVRIRRSAALAAAFLGGTVILAGCQEDQPVTTSPTIRPAQHAVGPSQGGVRIRPAEAQLFEIAQGVPGFGGMRLQPDGRLQVYVTRAADHAHAHAVVTARVQRNGLGLPPHSRPRSVAIVEGDYELLALAHYRDVISDSLLGVVPGLVSVDLDEAINRVTLGVLGASAASTRLAVEQHLKADSIPSDAINWEESPSGPHALDAEARQPQPLTLRPLLTSTVLYSSPDTLGGGFAFTDRDFNGYSHSCSIGMVVDSGTNRRFVSASHCTQTLFYRDGDTVTTVAGTRLGIETSDPNGNHSCTVPLDCWYWRSSDAALFSLSVGSPASRRGAVVRPESRDSLALGVSHDSTIDSTNPWLNVTRGLSASAMVTGLEVDHIGARSGWDHGTVLHTCEDVWLINEPLGERKVVYCETRATMIVRQGDSGGPAFVWDGADGIALAGIVNAGDGSSTTYGCPEPSCQEFTEVYFSNWESVLGDLGALTPTTEITVASPSVTGSLSSEPILSWSAVTTTHTTGTTEYRIFRAIWDASTYTWLQDWREIGSTTSTSYADTAVPVSLDSYAGTSQPPECTYTFVEYFVQAYNGGVASNSGTTYFQGDANGPNPNQIICFP